MASLPDIPDKILTERLVIRPPTPDDVEAIHPAVLESLDELSPWMAWATPDYSLHTCRNNTLEAIEDFQERISLRYHLHDRRTGEFIGGSGFHALNWQVPKLEIGYWRRSSKAGQGYVGEGVRALTRLALTELGMARVEIRMDADNLASRRVAERCGYRLEGRLKHESRSRDGRLRDTDVYALTALPEGY